METEQKQRVIILGCGYLGYNLYALLRNTFPTEIWGIDSPYVSKVLDFREVDAFNPDEIDALDFHDAVIIDAIGLVANNAVSENEEMALDGIAGNYRRLLRSLKKGGAKRFLFFSSGGTVYGNSLKPISEENILHPMTLYSRSKTREEEVIQESDLDYLILRLSNPYGGYQISGKRQGVIPILIRKAYQNDPFEMWIDGDSIRDYFYITDLAQAIRLLIQKEISREIINVGSGIGTSLNEVIHLTQEATGHPIRIVPKSSDVPVVRAIVLDISKLRRLTGYEPSVTMQQGIALENERIREELGL